MHLLFLLHLVLQGGAALIYWWIIKLDAKKKFSEFK